MMPRLWNEYCGDYEGYINKLCTRTLYDEYGQPHVCVDEYMKRRLEIKLISSIVTIP